MSAAFLVAAWARGQIAFSAIAGCLTIALAIVIGYYGAEQWATSGRMSQSVLSAVRHVASVHPPDRFFAVNLSLALIWKGVGLILLLAASGVTMTARQPGFARKAFATVSTLLFAFITALTIVQIFTARPWVGGLIAAGLVVVMAIVVPASGVVGHDLIKSVPDRMLCAFGVSEVVFAIWMWSLSTGGWFNYALEAVVIAAVVTARAMTRACERPLPRTVRLPLAIAALAVPAFAFTDIKQVLLKRNSDTDEVAAVVEKTGCAASTIFFVDLPGVNRVNGRCDIVYDAWLFPVFESMGLAEPRSAWLEQRVLDGSISAVATTSTGDKISGVNRSLGDLGFSELKRVGRYRVWMRSKPREFRDRFR